MRDSVGKLEGVWAAVTADALSIVSFHPACSATCL
jgi:hypothetical protein